MRPYLAIGAGFLVVVALFGKCSETLAGDESSRATPLRLPSFAAPVSGSTFSHVPWQWIGGGTSAIDLDYDGRDEIIAPINDFDVDRKTPVVVLSKDSNSNSYSPHTKVFFPDTIPKQVHSRVSEVADFNGDSRPDIFLGGTGFDHDPFPGEPDWLVLSSGKAGREGRSLSLP